MFTKKIDFDTPLLNWAILTKLQKQSVKIAKFCENLVPFTQFSLGKKSSSFQKNSNLTLCVKIAKIKKPSVKLELKKKHSVKIEFLCKLSDFLAIFPIIY